MRTFLLFSLMWAWLLQPVQASSFSASPLLAGNSQQADFLPAEQAFDLSVEPQANGETLLRWDIAPGYYLYQHRLQFSGLPAGVKPELPPGLPYNDEFFGDSQIYRDRLELILARRQHPPQKVGRETIRYCGTPLKYSFSEAAKDKSVTIVELAEKGKVQIQEHILKPLHDLREIRGTYEELTARKNYADTDVEDYLHITLTDEEDIMDVMDKLHTIYPNIMKLDYDNLRTRNSNHISGRIPYRKKVRQNCLKHFISCRTIRR